MAELYIVSTPIGNLTDITYRAVEVLNSVDRVLAEDTRRTAILFRHYGIRTPLVSAHAHNEAARTQQLLAWLADGERIALVSDAGTPLLSDPGARIVQTVAGAGYRVTPIPGASALLAALVASGLPPEPFTFFGFPPRSGRDRSALMQRLRDLDHTAVLYESPNRVVRLLHDLMESCGAERGVVVARELTKVHETFVRGTLSDVVAYYDIERPRGEVVVMIAGAVAAPPEPADAEQLVRELLAAGRSPRDAAREAARCTGLSRNQAYEIALSLSKQEGQFE